MARPNVTTCFRQVLFDPPRLLGHRARRRRRRRFRTAAEPRTGTADAVDAEAGLPCRAVGRGPATRDAAPPLPARLANQAPCTLGIRTTSRASRSLARCGGGCFDRQPDTIGGKRCGAGERRL